jgi:putative PEP-CTERM system TPR-repeat lipoprotein
MRPTISRSALATLTTTLLLGCGAGAPSGDIAAGKAHLDKGDYVAAAIEFKTVLQQNPESGESRYLLGIALRKAGNLAASEIELRKAAAAGFDKTLVHPELIAVLSESAQFAKVLSEAKPEESRSSKVKAELQARVGDAFLATGKRDKARAAFEDSLATDPASPGGKLGFARLSAMARDFAKAHQLTDEALATAPDSLDALQFKADLFVAEGKGKEAIAIYSKAIELRPAAVSLYLGFVPLLIADRDPKGAAEWLGKLKKAVPDTIIATYLEALIAYSNGDRGRARELVRIALKDAPDFPQALLLAGQTEHDLGGYVQAEEHLRKSITLMPEATQPRRLLASTYFRAGQLAKAQETITPLLKDSSTDGASWLLAGEFALSREIQQQQWQGLRRQCRFSLRTRSTKRDWALPG